MSDAFTQYSQLSLSDQRTVDALIKKLRLDDDSFIGIVTLEDPKAAFALEAAAAKNHVLAAILKAAEEIRPLAQKRYELREQLYNKTRQAEDQVPPADIPADALQRAKNAVTLDGCLHHKVVFEWRGFQAYLLKRISESLNYHKAARAQEALENYRQFLETNDLFPCMEERLKERSPLADVQKDAKRLPRLG